MTLKELKDYKATAGRKIIVIGPNVYGIGLTGDEACKLARRPRQWIAYDCHEKTTVSHFDGGLSLAAEDNIEKLPREQCFIEIGRSAKLAKTS